MKRFDPGAEENGADLSISLPGGPTEPRPLPRACRSNAVRGLTSEAQIEPKMLQQRATDERTD